MQTLPETDSLRLMNTVMSTRVQDIQFVLDELAALKAGGNPDADKRRLPEHLDQVLDLSKVGVFGHSAGGFTAAELMYSDKRILAGVNMEGDLLLGNGLSPVAKGGLNRPFMFLGSSVNGEPWTHETSPSWKSFWVHSKGAKLDLNAPAARHFSFTYYQFILPMLQNKMDLPVQVVDEMDGTVDPARMISAERAYLASFFDQHLRGIPQRLLQLPESPYSVFHLVHGKGEEEVREAHK
ncbi:hypothetical protein FHS19_006316 [Paenibacillus rhizosphaerae]|uniref:Uncharacterized protein n=1 Tax=Paenibacillus rhizosphaerae TaxID=297318 RepID=A0A839TYM1_9BACL|nr:hypothetical protein [Paenibacillus rhizosphaerae]MBB3131593.1 hypothetical protein [Paenibacillus rhizosphaerae]